METESFKLSKDEIDGIIQSDEYEREVDLMVARYGGTPDIYQEYAIDRVIEKRLLKKQGKKNTKLMLLFLICITLFYLLYRMFLLLPGRGGL